MLRRRAELEHEGLDVGSVRGGVERGGVEGGEGARLAAGERAVERELPERSGGALGLHRDVRGGRQEVDGALRGKG